MQTGENSIIAARISELSRNTILKHAQWTKGLQNVVRSLLDADGIPDFHQNLIMTFWPICDFP